MTSVSELYKKLKEERDEEKKRSENMSEGEKSHPYLFSKEIKEAIGSSLSEEDKEKYKSQGEYMYGYDYENPKNYANVVKSYSIICALRSGLLPDELSEEELKLLCEVYGEDWKSLL